MLVGNLLSIILSIICIIVLYKSYNNVNKAIIWSPITFITLTILYYLVFPQFFTSREFEGYNVETRSLSFHIGAILSYISILVGYFCISPNKPVNWSTWNNNITENNSYKLAIILFIFSMVCHVPYRGIHLTFLSNGSDLVEFDYSNPGFSYYFVNMIAMLCASCCLLIPNWKNHKITLLSLLWITLVTFIVAGFRYRIVILVLSMFTVYYLYCNPIKKIKFIPIAIIALICYIGFNIMDHARDYGNGIRLDKIANMDRDEVTAQAGETERVFNYSIMVMDVYETEGKREYFAPLINAIFMPIPRVVFPWKPKAEYAYTSQAYVMRGGGTASVYVYFVEAFMAFGWIGIILNGIFIGWIGRKFWNNYRFNNKSLGAILALALFNGFTYVIVSRGYLAQQYSCFLFFVCFPFWFVSFLNFLKRSLK